MNESQNESRWPSLLMGVGLGLLLALLFAAMTGVEFSPALVNLLMIAIIAAGFFMLARALLSAGAEPTTPTPPASAESAGGLTTSGAETAEWPSELPVAFDDIFTTRFQRREGEAMIVEGELQIPSDQAHEQLQRRFAETEYLPMLQTGNTGEPVLVLLPRRMVTRPGAKNRPWLNGLLLLATLLTTVWAGALHQGVNLLNEPERFTVGLPYALALLLILGAHELGHYIAARVHGIDVSLPYFIPVPFALGTFGAFISIRSISEHRRALFDVAVAGPLAGLVFAIPALWIGLQYSTVSPEAVTQPMMLHQGASAGSSVLLALVASASIPEAIQQGHQLQLHPLAFAGWLGLFITALNLLPVGQLDGGHIADAMFGARGGRIIGTVAMVGLVLLGLFVWSGLLMWALLIYFIAGRKGMPPLDDVTPMSRSRWLLGWFALALLVAILLPVPHALYDSFGIHCPYA